MAKIELNNNLLSENADKVLSLDNTDYRTYYNSKFINRKPYTAPNHKIVTAFMPGTILNLFIKPGDKVKKGDKLLIFEAMKMKNWIFAEINGTVKKINVKQGDRIAKDEVILEFK